MADISQMEKQVLILRRQKDELNKKIEAHQTEMTKLQSQRDKFQEQIDELMGTVDEDGDAAITTTSVGNASVYGGSANFAPKMGMVRRAKKKNNKYESRVCDYLDSLFE